MNTSLNRIHNELVDNFIWLNATNRKHFYSICCLGETKEILDFLFLWVTLLFQQEFQ